MEHQPITKDQSKAARRELNMTQQQVADAMGVGRTKLSWLESGKLVPDTEYLEDLRAFYERNGIKVADEHDDDSEAAGQGEPQTPKKAQAVATKGQHIRVNPDLTSNEVDAVFAAIEAQEGDIINLMKEPAVFGPENHGFLGGILSDDDTPDGKPNEATVAARDALMARLATSAMLWRIVHGSPVVNLQGRDVLEDVSGAKTVGEVVARTVTMFAYQDITERQCRYLENAASTAADEQPVTSRDRKTKAQADDEPAEA